MAKIMLLCLLIASVLVASSWADILAGSPQTRDAPPKGGQFIGASTALFVIASMLSVV
jgi:hypothetical protein